MSYKQKMYNRKSSGKKIVGNNEWTKAKYSLNGKTINRNNLKFNHPQSYNKDYNQEALNNGWEYNQELKNWSHPTYFLSVTFRIYE